MISFVVGWSQLYFDFICSCTLKRHRSVPRSYKQNKYNLFREESEGYAKLTTELSQEITSKISPDYMIEVMRSLIGEARWELFPFIYSYIFMLSRSRGITERSGCNG